MSKVLFVVFFVNAAYAQEGVHQTRPKSHVPVLTRAPELMRFVEAPYPEEAQASGLSAAVELEVEIGADGTVTAASVTQQAGHGFDEAALAAVRQFVFSPAEVDGVPSPIRVLYTYRFELRTVEVARPLELPPGSRPPRVKGVVREMGTRVPVAGAAVSVSGVAEKTTDARGQFSLSDVPPGKALVRASSPEHEPDTVEVEVPEDEAEAADVTFFLRPLVDNPYETVVRGEREMTVVSRVSLRQKEMQTVPGTFGDPARVIQNLPGMARAPYALAGLLVRGAAASDSAVFLDGVEIPLLYHFLGGPSVLNAEFLDRIDYYPGNFPARYGRASAGVVEVQSRKMPPDAWHGVAKVDLLDASVFVEGPVTDRWSVAGAFRRSYIDAILPLVINASGAKNVSTVAPAYYDYQVRTNLKLSGDDRLSLFVFGSDDTLKVVASPDGSAKRLNLLMGFHAAKLDWFAKLSNTLSQTFSPYVSYNVLRFGLSDAGADSDSIGAGLREDLSWQVTPALELTGGLDFAYLYAWRDFNLSEQDDYSLPGAGGAEAGTDDGPDGGPGGGFPMTATATRMGLAGYLQAAWDVGGGVRLIPSLRCEWYRYGGSDHPALDPRLTARWTVAPGSTLKAGAGLFHEMPAAQYLDPDTGNPRLLPPWADQYSLGLEQAIWGPVTLDVQGFFLRRHDVVAASDAATVSGSGVLQEHFANTGEGRAYGLEVLLKHQVTDRFYGWIAYTLSRSETRDRSSEPWAIGSYDQTHIFTFVGNLQLGRGWEMGARFRLVSGNPTTPRDGSTFDADSNAYPPLLGTPNSARLPMFHQLDLRVEKTWTFQSWSFSTYLDVQNVYNQTNQESKTYDYRSRDYQYVAGLPILPTLGFKGRF